VLHVWRNYMNRMAVVGQAARHDTQVVLRATAEAWLPNGEQRQAAGVKSNSDGVASFFSNWLTSGFQ